MKAGDRNPGSMANLYSFVLETREARREPGTVRRLRDEGIREVAHYRRLMRRRILARARGVK